ncbi:MAG TPA: cytochrome P450 [Kofleriaceae bacterium]|nr:cytochrome P450 [Kofleriaceae bacterium]
MTNEVTMQVQSIIDRVLGRRPPLPAGLRLAPQLSGGLPIVGHTVEFIRASIELLHRAHRENGEIVSFQVFNRKMVAVFGPEAHEAVFRAPDRQLSPQEAYKIMTPVFGKDIVYDASPEKMAEQLKMLLPALKDRRMRTYGEAVVFETEKTIASWGEMGVVDFVDFCRVLTNFTSSRCLLGPEFRDGMTEEFAAVYHDLERGVTPIAYINAHLPIPAFRKRDKARVRMVEMISEIVEQRRAHGRVGEDFLQTLMDSKYADGRSLSEHEITGMLLAAMFAGHHTSSVTTAWTLLELLQNPEAMRRCKDEIDRVFGKGEPVSHQALRELTFTENTVKESLRMHPPLFLLVRVAMQDFVYKDYFVPKGTWIVISPTVSHRMPEVFADPDRFDPDRFAPPREEDKRDFAFISFGGGRHKCLGNAFAILQIKAILALLIGQYDFELGGDPIASDFQGLVVTPKEPCRVRYKRREHPSVTLATAAELVKTAAQLATAAAAEAPPECPAHVGTNGTGKAHAATIAAAKAAGCPAHAGAAQATAPQPKAAGLTIVLDTDVCQGHAVCCGEAPEVFRLGDDGKVEAIMTRPPAELEDKVRAAAQYCPTRAIRLIEA